MILECTKEKISRAITLAERAAGKNLALPILSTILLEAEGKEMKIKATNLEIGIEAKVPARISEPGKAAVKASVLNSFLGSLRQEDKIKIELINDNIHISTAASSTLIKCQPTDDFPSIPRVKDGRTANLEAGQLANGLRSVLYASAISDIKPEIASVYIYQDNQDIFFVATDSFRLAEKRLSLGEKKDGDPVSVILPNRSVAELIRALEDNVGDVKVKIAKNQASFETDDSYFTTTVIDGVYPDYRQIMPKGSKAKAIVFKSDLIDALKMSNIFADRFNQINLRVLPKDNLFEFNSKNQEVGENTVSIKADLTGEDISASFNARYLLDCLQSITSDQVVLAFTDANRPLLVTGAGDQSFRYLVMPINR